MSHAAHDRHKLCPEGVYDFLREEILSRRLAPGAPLGERIIAEQHGVSRTPVREALHRLEAEGLARRYPRMGMVVAELTLQDVIESFQIRQFIEPPAAREAAEKLQPQPLLELLAQFKAQEQDDNPGMEAIALHNSLDAQLHDIILRSLGNKRLVDLMENLMGVCSRARRLGTPIRFCQSRQEHIALLQALIDRNGPEAERAMREHLENTRQRLLSAL